MTSMLFQMAAAAGNAEFTGYIWRTVVVGTLMFALAGGVLVAFLYALRRSGQNTRPHAVVLLVLLIVVLATFAAVLAWLSYD